MSKVFKFKDRTVKSTSSLINAPEKGNPLIPAEIIVCKKEELPQSADPKKIFIVGDRFFQGQGIGAPLRKMDIGGSGSAIIDGQAIDLDLFRKVDTKITEEDLDQDLIDKIANISINSFEDVFHVADGQTQSEFILTYKPIGKIRMYVDGLRYFQSCFQYNAATNTVKWINGASNPEGFDITDADVVFEYDYQE